MSYLLNRAGSDSQLSYPVSISMARLSVSFCMNVRFMPTFSMYSMMDSNQQNDSLSTAEQLARHLAVSASTVQRLTRGGQVPCIQIRSLVRYDLNVVLGSLKAQDRRQLS